jgi:hypothetical protein
MATYRSRSHDDDGSLLLQLLAALILGITLAAASFIALIWIWAGTTP